jgi:hypothetical protein
MEAVEIVVNGINGLMELFKGDEEIIKENEKLRKLIESINNKIKIYQSEEFFSSNFEIMNICKQIAEK